jgi:hemerythrin-like domain-containing protein
LLVDVGLHDDVGPAPDLRRQQLTHLLRRACLCTNAERLQLRLHHPKESGLLFPKVRARRPDLAAVFDALDQDHHRGEASARDLQHRLLAYELLGEPRREAFEAAARRYVEHYLRHMSLEESTVPPAARESLLPEEWHDLNTAFEANRDPLAGHDPSGEYAPLFRKIVNTAPAPVGLGE